jgi:ADP-heptose:LPS heptosyltransferase
MRHKPRLITSTRKSKKNIFNKLSTKDKPKICIKRRLGGIGDVIMSLPSLKMIKTLYPNSELVYATDTKYMKGSLQKVLEHNPYVDKIIHYKDIVDSRYDLISDITVTGLDEEKPKTIPPNRIDLFAKEIGLENLEDPIPTYIVTEEEKKEAKDFILENTGNKREDINFIVIQARSNDVRRCWPLEYVEELANRLATDNTYVMVCDWKDNYKWELEEQCFLYRGEINLTAALIEQADLIVCPDSSVLHLAGSLWKPTIALFGPIPPESRCNHYPTVKPLQIKLRCSSCFYIPTCRKNKPSSVYMDCMNKLSVDKVYKECITMLSKDIELYEQPKFGKELTKYKTDDIVLVKRSSAGIGDLVMALNGIEKLTKRFPAKKIHLAVQKSLIPVAENNPYIDKVIDIKSPINLKRYFAVFDISSPCAKYESSRILLGKDVQKTRVEIFAEALGTRKLLTDILPKFYLTPEEQKYGLDIIQGLPQEKGPKICISLYSAEDYRSYPHMQELVSLLKYKGITPIILNLNNNLKDVIAFTDKTIREAAAILNASDGLITVDTGWLHVAAALNKKTLALFGPIDYKARCKQYKQTKVILSSNRKCIPCWRNSEIKCKVTKTLGSSQCLSDITPNLIAKEALNYFGEE